MSLDDLRDDSGALSPEKATAAIDKVLEERPHWRKPETGARASTAPDVHNGPRPPVVEPLSFGRALRDVR